MQKSPKSPAPTDTDIANAAGVADWVRERIRLGRLVPGQRLVEADIVVTPGVGFGKSGEGYVRMSLTVPVERIHLAVQRLAKVLA